MFNYQFEGTKIGCDCTNSSFQSNLKIVSQWECTSDEILAGCKKIDQIKSKVLSLLRNN